MGSYNSKPSVIGQEERIGRQSGCKVAANSSAAAVSETKGPVMECQKLQLLLLSKNENPCWTTPLISQQIFIF